MSDVGFVVVSLEVHRIPNNNIRYNEQTLVEYDGNH